MKKRFKITASGKFTAAKTGKRHNMIKRTSKQIRQLRGTGVVNATSARKVKPMTPYGL